MKKDVQIQRQYYTETASRYDDIHSGEDGAHEVALKYISSFINLLKISSILDVGCGTGRGVKYFLENHSNLKVVGVEPVKALIEQAILKNEIRPELIICGDGESLPFDDNSFDAVCAFGVMHHAANPSAVVSEMMRVAKKAVLISDGNRFGQDKIFPNCIKLLLYKAKLWGLANFIKTKGRGYMISEGDGLAYSYSVFDQYDILASWADRLILIPTCEKQSLSWYHPLLTSSHVLLCAIKENQE